MDSFFAEVQMEPRFIETQLQVIRSERVAYAAIDSLNLPKILAEKSASWLAMLSDAPSGEGELARRAGLKSVQQGLVAQQAGLSEVVEIRYTSDDRELASTIVNAIVRSYIAEQEAARSDAAQAGSSWLRERLREVGPRARVLTVATPPKDKSNMRGILLIALLGLGGLFAGAFIALARGLLDRAVRVPEHLDRAAAGPFLGLLSRQDQTPPALARSSAQVDEHTLRQIRSTWDALPPRRGARTLGIVSTHRGEGRSHVAFELARSLKLAGRKTLLVCADPFGDSHPDDNEPGLAQWCGGEAKSIGDLIKIGGDDGTDYLPSGRGEIDWGGSITGCWTRWRTATSTSFSTCHR